MNIAPTLDLLNQTQLFIWRVTRYFVQWVINGGFAELGGFTKEVPPPVVERVVD